MKKIEHIGIAVSDIEQANSNYAELFNSTPYKEEEVASENVRTSFFMMGDSKIELLQATSEDSAIAKYIQKRGEGIHHIAYAVDNIIAERERLINAGFQAIGDIKNGADNKLVCFFHPKSANGVLVELCQERG
ncbi:MAG TPA: methylmalonyl-CoA epimerase [Flavobacteriales bacterium]|jgi:methylmalonyl-CoA/ethylmalonyl-CoA epimerase|nr:methylmalonyl-CoA epimerase [Flavobacteriales bacterium]HAW20766.1 methylmalonyl-CoA epimerase [Flavobacteriales bacterium]